MFGFWLFLSLVAFMLLAGGVALLLRRKSSLIAAILMVALFNLISSCVPVAGIGREITIASLGIVSLAFILALGLRLEKCCADQPSDRRVLVKWSAMVGLLILVFLIVSPWMDRFRFAVEVHWACDGTVVQKYRSHNHNAATLVVMDRSEHRHTFEGIDEKLWSAAHLQDHLQKLPGQNTASLNGQSFIIVRDRIHWFGLGANP